ncbi:hypothetical protein SCLCIDRAFT_24881 [Scleroderma citrinum Foug A]|uniref:Uncharacterized protein n=1 Tax=Scleroderma citrinum Foug A TaxID=1036808 RepID=A0A0C3ACE0_9AGAM|nr:hypothetical protein SCLCIDRAFT_24881 [Scleroderma citrinum Foug A]
MVTDSTNQSDIHAKRQWEPIEEDNPETTVVKAQKLTEHEGRPRCHAPNMFGTVNMEHTIDSRLSWSE